MFLTRLRVATDTATPTAPAADMNIDTIHAGELFTFLGAAEAGSTYRGEWLRLQPVAHIDDPRIATTALYAWLIYRTYNTLKHHRRLHDVHVDHLATAGMAFSIDYARNVSDLSAWSALYHCTLLDHRKAALAAAAGIAYETVNRCNRLGIDLLLDTIRHHQIMAATASLN